jgi:hypothetical protein
MSKFKCQNIESGIDIIIHDQPEEIEFIFFAEEHEKK